jgi:hypothetical protein
MIGIAIFASYLAAIVAGAAVGWWLKRRQILRPIPPHEFWGGGPRG